MRQIRACRCLSVLAQSSPERVWPRSSGDSCYSWIKLQGFSTWRKPDPDQMNPRSSGWSKKRTLLCLCRLFHWRLSQKQINSSVYSSPSSAHNLCQCTAVSEKWLLSYQWIGPDKMEDSGSGWGCSKVCERKKKKRGGGTVRWKHKRLVLMCRAQQSRDSRGEERRGKEGRMDVKEESRGVDGWRSRVGGVEGSVLGAVHWPLIRFIIYWDAPHEKTSTACQEYPPVNISTTAETAVFRVWDPGETSSLFYTSHLGSH